MEADVTQTALFFRLWSWVENHRKVVLRGAIVAAVAAFIIGLLIYRRSERQVSANDALSKIICPALFGGPQPAPDALLKIVSQYANTAASGRALLVAGSAYYTGGSYPDARAQFERYLRSNPNGAFAGQARLGVASSLEAEGSITDAMNAYRDLAERHPDDSVLPQAKIAMGRLAELQGNFDLAHDCYAEIARPEYGPFGMEAESRLRELVIRHSGPAPVAPASTNTPPLIPPQF